jgi:acyl-CoA reductase-like NAD-dependent aldehyde dehydrogenase
VHTLANADVVQKIGGHLFEDACPDAAQHIFTGLALEDDRAKGRSAARCRIASRIRAGMVYTNDQTVNNEPHVPFGGMGASGNSGRLGGPASLHEFTKSQWVSVAEKPTEYPF